MSSDTLREKIGQLLMVGISGPALTSAEQKRFTAHPPGGILLLGRNLKTPRQIARLTAALQRLAPKGHPLFIAVDQEGGRVSRLPLPFTHFPSAATVGHCHSHEMAYRVGEALAAELSCVGITMNLAPVLDVNTHPQNPAIGDRSYGSSPTLVSSLGLAIIAGLQDHGVIACGKHFPGHGATDADSHKTLPVVPHPLAQMRECDLKPFLHAVSNGLGVVMTAHVLYPKIDKKWPATFSSLILRDLLRGEMCFQGLVLTDDLEMRAVTDHFSVPEAAVKAIRAGADMLLLGGSVATQDAVLKALGDAVASGVLTEERINRSLQRISLITKRHLSAPRPADPTEIKQVVGSPSHRRLAEEIKEKAREKAAAHA